MLPTTTSANCKILQVLAYNVKAEVYYSYNDYRMAQELSTKSIETMTRSNGFHNKDRAAMYLNLGRAYRELQKYPHAVACFQMAQREYAGSLGGNHWLTEKTIRETTDLIESLDVQGLLETVTESSYYSSFQINRADFNRLKNNIIKKILPGFGVVSSERIEIYK